MGEVIETFHRTVRLRPDLLPVDVFTSDGTPIPVTRAQVVEVKDVEAPSSHRFVLQTLDDAGVVHESLAFETLQIAVD